MRANFFLRVLSAPALLWPVMALHADPAGEETLRKGEARQQQIQSDAQKIAGAISVLIGEYERNNIQGDELVTLRRFKGMLENLNKKEMRDAADLIERARQSGGGKAQVADAYSSEKRLIVSLKQLIAAHLRNEQALEIANAVSQIADRQAINLQNGIDFGAWPDKATGLQVDEARKASLQGQGGEQRALDDEFKLVAAKIEAFSKGATNDDLARRYQHGFDQAKVITPLLASAAKSLEDKQVPDALGSERKARDFLRQLAQWLAPPKERVKGLRNAASELQEMISKQSEVVAHTTNIVARKERDEVTQQTTIHAKDSETDLATRGESLVRQIAPDAPEAALAAQSATANIQAARKDLEAFSDQNAQNILRNERNGLENLQKALAMLQEKTVEEPKHTPLHDPYAMLQLMEKTVRNLMAQQETAKSANLKDPQQAKTATKQQEGLRKQTAQLAKQAVPDSQEAAQTLSQAANAMQKAADAMQNPERSANAAPLQQDAANALAKADEQFKEAIAKLQQMKGDLGRAKHSADELAHLIQNQQKLEAATAKAAMNEQSQPAPVKALAQQAANGAQEASTIQKSLPKNAADAQQALAGAEGQMNETREALNKAQATTAQQSEKAALENLYKAQDALQQQIAAEQAELGQQQTTDPANAAKLAAQLAQAQQKIAQARDQIGESQAAQENQGSENSKVGKGSQAKQEERDANGEKGSSEKNDAHGSETAQAGQKGSEPGHEPGEKSGSKDGKESQGEGEQGGKTAGEGKGSSEKGEAQGGKTAQAGEQGSEGGKGSEEKSGSEGGKQAQSGQPSSGKPGSQASGTPGSHGGTPTPGMQKAASQLNEAAGRVADVGANSTLPSSLQPALREAQQALADATGAASSGDASNAQNSAAAAQAAIASAQAQLAEAQAGIASAEGKSGQGQGQGSEGQGQSQEQGGQSQQPSEGRGKGGTKYYQSAQTPVQAGQQQTPNAGGRFLALPSRDRQAIEQSQAEKYPEEYGAAVEQYFQNLANDTSK